MNAVMEMVRFRNELNRLAVWSFQIWNYKKNWCNNNDGETEQGKKKSVNKLAYAKFYWFMIIIFMIQMIQKVNWISVREKILKHKIHMDVFIVRILVLYIIMIIVEKIVCCFRFSPCKFKTKEEKKIRKTIEQFEARIVDGVCSCFVGLLFIFAARNLDFCHAFR